MPFWLKRSKGSARVSLFLPPALESKQSLFLSLVSPSSQSAFEPRTLLWAHFSVCFPSSVSTLLPPIPVCIPESETLKGLNAGGRRNKIRRE